MGNSFLEKFVASQSNMRRYQQERAILEATGEICLALEAEGLSRADLAARLGKTAGWVTQLLDGEKNKTIRTIADVLAVLNREMHVSSRPISIGGASADSPSAEKIYRIGDYHPVAVSSDSTMRAVN